MALKEANSPRSKKSRSSNFSQVEELSLIEIVKNNDFGPILEKHRNDFATVALKRKTWDLIYAEWESLPNVSNRTLDQLQMKWKALVKQAKSKDADYKRKTKQTGGGEVPEEPDQKLVIVKQLLSNTFSEIPNPFDGDSSFCCQLAGTQSFNEETKGILFIPL